MPTRREFSRASFAAIGALAFGRGRWPGLQSSPTVNGARLNSHLEEMSRFGANPQGGVSRVAYSDFDRQGREYAIGLMRAARLEPRIDAAGNISARRPGTVATLKPIVFGSHIDSVPEGGNYDGTVGSLGAIEVAQTLAEKGVTTRHPLEVVIFQNEEGGTVGSRALIGELTDHDLGLTARSGKTLRAGIDFLGGNVAELGSVLRKPGDVAAYVELHIEQGGNLEREKLDIGVVEGIVGISWWDVTIEGFANHAGTTAMSGRRDAMLAAARFTDMVNRVITSEPGRQVGTIGRLSALPGVPNVIPGKVVCSLEIRDLDNAKIERLFGAIRAEAAKIAEATGTTFSYAITHDSKSALTDPRVQKAVETSARDAGLTSRYLPSGAGHDAQHMARICPSGMIFIPSKDGISHAPREYSAPQDIVNGANVLLRTVLALDAAPWT